MYDLNLAIVIAKHGQILFVANNVNTELASILASKFFGVTILSVILFSPYKNAF